MPGRSRAEHGMTTLPIEVPPPPVLPHVGVFESKPLQYYRGLRVKADVGLHEQVAGLVAETAPRRSRVLDYGCGEGALSLRMRELGYDVTAVDRDAAAFRSVARFQRLDFSERRSVDAFLARNAGRFDVVLSVEVIEHLENPWQYVRDLSRLLRPGGQAIITTPNVTSWYSRTRFLLSGRMHQFEDGDQACGHINPIAEDELRLICQRSGMPVEEIVPGGWLPRLWLRPSTPFVGLLGFLASFGMRGTRDGWSIIARCRKLPPSTRRLR